MPHTLHLAAHMLEYFFLIRPEQIALFRFILEGYDGLAVLSTMNQEQGLVRILVPESRVKELWHLLDSLSPELVNENCFC